MLVKIIGLRGIWVIYSKISGDWGENVMVVICVSVFGLYIFFMIIFKG